jgi:hypothetical protein
LNRNIYQVVFKSRKIQGSGLLSEYSIEDDSRGRDGEKISSEEHSLGAPVSGHKSLDAAERGEPRLDDASVLPRWGPMSPSQSTRYQSGRPQHLSVARMWGVDFEASMGAWHMPLDVKVCSFRRKTSEQSEHRWRNYKRQAA